MRRGVKATDEAETVPTGALGAAAGSMDREGFDDGVGAGVAAKEEEEEDALGLAVARAGGAEAGAVCMRPARLDTAGGLAASGVVGTLSAAGRIAAAAGAASAGLFIGRESLTR